MLPASPIRKNFGYGKGICLDRIYIEKFLSQNAHFITGTVLEIADDAYSKKFGYNIIKQDVLHVSEKGPKITIIGDFTKPEFFSSNVYDCIILTQTLQFIPNVSAAIKTLHKILKPGGVVLVTTSCISQLSQYDVERWGEYWRFTPQGLTYLFEQENNFRVTIESFGNVKIATAFLYGIVAQEINNKDFYFKDKNYPIIIGCVAIKN